MDLKIFLKVQLHGDSATELGIEMDAIRHESILYNVGYTIFKKKENMRTVNPHHHSLNHNLCRHYRHHIDNS